jgi:hypothetical protein
MINFRDGRFHIKSIALVTGLMFAQSAYCQSTDQKLATALMSSAEKIYPAAASSPNEFVASREFRLLGTPILIPNVLEASSALSSQLTLLEQIPPLSGELISTISPMTISSVLNSLQSDAQLAKRTATGAALEQLKASRSLLYGQSESTPSKAYSTYLDFQKRYNFDLERLKSETNPAARTNLQNRLGQLDGDWATFGMRSEIEAALADVAKNSPNQMSNLQTDFFSQLAKYEPNSPDPIRKALSSAEWIRVSASSNEFADLSLSLSASGQTIALPKMLRFSYDVTLVAFNRSILTHPFLLSHEWRLKSGSVLSDGNPGVDGKNELLPRATTHALVIKNLEIIFKQDVPARSLQLISTSGNVSINTVPIKTPQAGTPAYQSRSISVPNPILLGVLIANLAKIPDPALGVQWEN